MNRTAKAKLNILVSLGFQIVTLLCGFVVPRLLIGAFGSEAYGATASITQFLAYITLLEGGIGGVARAALYQPLAEENMEQVSRVVAEIRAFFRVIGCIFAVYVLVLACAFRTIAHVTVMDQLTTFLLVIVISLSTFGQYFIGISNAVLLQASQRAYITNGISVVTTLLNAVLVVILTRLECSLILVKLVSSCIFVLRPVAMWCYVRKNYSLVKVAKGKESCLPQKWSGLGQHIAFFLHSNTDTVVLTLLADLKTVAVYAVYNMIVSHMQQLAASVLSGMESVFGDMLAKREYDRLHRTFSHYETLISLVAVTLFSATAVLIVPFIRIYTADISDADYIAPVFGVLLVLASLLYCLRQPYHTMVIAAGHFRQTQIAAYGEAALNVVLSVLLVSRYGLVGVAIGTVAATAFRFAYYVWYLSRNIIRRPGGLFAKRMGVNALAFAAAVVLGNGMMDRLSAPDYLRWAVCAVVVAAVCGGVTLAVNTLFYREDLKGILGKRKRR